jgi:hypothetical protein
VEVVADTLRRMRARRAMPPAEPRPLSRGVWIFAAVLDLLFAWAVAGQLAPSLYRYPVVFYSLALLLLGNPAGITIMAFDVFLIWRVVKLRRSSRAR